MAENLQFGEREIFETVQKCFMHAKLREKTKKFYDFHITPTTATNTRKHSENTYLVQTFSVS